MARSTSRMPQNESQSIYFSKISWEGACPQTPKWGHAKVSMPTLHFPLPHSQTQNSVWAPGFFLFFSNFLVVQIRFWFAFSRKWFLCCLSLQWLVLQLHTLLHWTASLFNQYFPAFLNMGVMCTLIWSGHYIQYGSHCSILNLLHHVIFATSSLNFCSCPALLMIWILCDIFKK